MPAWPTLFPLFRHYKRDPPGPHGGGDSESRRGNGSIVNEQFPEGLKGRDLFYK
jgi:hypothetical protein